MRVSTSAACLSVSYRVCLLGVFALIVSWGSLGLELAVAVVSGSGSIPIHLLLQVYQTQD